MTKRRRIACILVAGFVALIGLRYRVDYCRYTAEWIGQFRLLGIPIPFTSTHGEGYRAWLEHDIGATFPREYVFYLSYHPLLPVVSTPPGNWLSLRTLKQIYDADPASHEDVSRFVKMVAARQPPLFGGDDWIARNELVHRFLERDNP